MVLLGPFEGVDKDLLDLSAGIQPGTRIFGVEENERVIANRPSVAFGIDNGRCESEHVADESNP